MTNDLSRNFKGVVWPQDREDAFGVRVEVFATSHEDAVRQLHAIHGENIIVTVFNEEEADRPRRG